MRFPVTVAVLAGATVAVVSVLQQSLVLVRAFGHLTHWTAVLLVVPLLVGLAAAFISARPYVASFAASLIASSVLYVLYTQFFWAKPPSVLQAAAFFGTLALFSVFGVTLARTVRKPKLTKKRKTAVRRTLLVAYHVLAFAAAVVTLLGFLRES